MKLDKKLLNVSSKEDFSNFLEDLGRNSCEKSDEWKNREIGPYLDAVSSWVEDMEGYYQNMNKEVPEYVDWNFIATLFYVGKIYE